MQSRSSSLVSLIGRLATGCVEAQRILDRRQANPPLPQERGEDDHPAPEQPAFYFRTHAIDARVLVRRRRSTAVGGRVNLFGEPLHSFLYHRIATETTTFNRISIEVEVTPLRDPSTPERQEPPHG